MLAFRELLDRTRHAMALVHVADPRLSFVQVAAILGFASQAAFNRAFQRWTGISPRPGGARGEMGGSRHPGG